MKALFVAIRHGDTAAVQALLDKKPELIRCKAKQPPKKDDGQSPLQVAFKTGQWDIVELLLDRGADVNYIEDECINEWRAPVLHDAIRAAFFSSRGVRSDQTVFDRALHCLKRMIASGADVHQPDSYGNLPIMRAALDAGQWPLDDPKHNTKLLEDFTQIFQVLLAAGANIHASTPTRQSVADMYKDEPVAQLFQST